MILISVPYLAKLSALIRNKTNNQKIAPKDFSKSASFYVIPTDILRLLFPIFHKRVCLCNQDRSR